MVRNCLYRMGFPVKPTDPSLLRTVEKPAVRRATAPTRSVPEDLWAGPENNPLVPKDRARAIRVNRFFSQRLGAWTGISAGVAIPTIALSQPDVLIPSLFFGGCLVTGDFLDGIMEARSQRNDHRQQLFSLLLQFSIGGGGVLSLACFDSSIFSFGFLMVLCGAASGSNFGNITGSCLYAYCSSHLKN